MKDNKLLLLIIIIVTMIITITLTLFLVEITGDYEYISKIKIVNMTTTAYIQGALSISETGNIPYLYNDTIQITTINDVCDNLNNQEAKKSEQ